MFKNSFYGRIIPFYAALAGILLACTAGPGFAQAQIPGVPDEPAAPSVETKVVETRIAIADIPTRADNDDFAIHEITREVANNAQELSLASDLQGIADRVAALGAKYQNKDMAKLPIRRLESLKRHWQFIGAELEAWHSGMQSLIHPLAENELILVEYRRIWGATRDDATLPPPLVQRIDELLRNVDAADAAVSVPLGRLLELDRKASAVRRQISKELIAVSALIERIDLDLTRIDSPNLLEALQGVDKSQVIGADLLENGLDIETEFSKDFNKHADFTRLAAGVAAILLLPLFFWLARRARQKIADGSVPEIYTNALTRPFAAWLLLVAMSFVLINLHGPLVRLQFWLLVAWVPVMRLLPIHVAALIRPWMILSALFFALNLFSFLVTSEPLLFRLLLLLNGVLMLCTMAWMLSRSPTAIQTKTTWQLLAVRVLLILGIGVLAISIVANVIGNVTLAAMLTDSTLNSSYIGMFLSAVATVITAFSLLLFSHTAVSLRNRSQHAGGLIDVLGRLFTLTLLVSWVLGTLGLFRILRPLADFLSAVSAFTFKLGNISVSIGGIVLFLVSVYLSFWIAKTVRSILGEDVLPHMTLPRGVANSVSTMSYYVLLIAGLTVALAAAGFQFSELALVLGALSVGIGIGLQDVVKNFVSGLILMIERPVQPGDTIELSGTVGKVREIGIRATTLATTNGADVVVPNGMLLAEKMTNWTLSNDNRRVEIPVGVAYGNEPETVLALLLKVAENTPGVCREPPPSVLFTGFGQSSLDFNVRAWTDSYDDAVFVRSALAVGIHAALKQAGIEVPFPQQDLHIKSVETDVFSCRQVAGQ